MPRRANRGGCGSLRCGQGDGGRLRPPPPPWSRLASHLISAGESLLEMLPGTRGGMTRGVLVVGTGGVCLQHAAIARRWHGGSASSCRCKAGTALAAHRRLLRARDAMESWRTSSEARAMPPLQPRRLSPSLLAVPCRLAGPRQEHSRKADVLEEEAREHRDLEDIAQVPRQGESYERIQNIFHHARPRGDRPGAATGPPAERPHSQGGGAPRGPRGPGTVPARVRRGGHASGSGPGVGPGVGKQDSRAVPMFVGLRGFAAGPLGAFH